MTLRESVLPLALSHEWEQLSALPDFEQSRDPVVTVAKGLRTAFRDDDLDAGLALLDDAAKAGQRDGLIQGALVRCLADREWDEVDRAMQQVVGTPLLDDQFGAVTLVLEKLASRLPAERALPLWNELLKLDETSAVAYQRRGRIFFHQKNFAAALTDANKHVELEPRNRLAWLARAAVKEALGDVAGAEADRLAGAPFYDVHTDEAVQAQAATLLAGDRDDNLSSRLSFFDQLGLHGLEQAIIVLEEQWCWVEVPAEDDKHALAMTIGLFYRYGQPDLMVHHDSEMDTVALKTAIEEHVTRAQDGETISAGDTVTVDGKTVKLEVPTKEDLAAYPYGYGQHFYRHFMDRPEVPLLLARFV